MAKEKKVVPPTERLKHLKPKKRNLTIGEIGCAVAPMGILTIVNFQDYFVKTEAWRTSISFIMLIITTLISVAIITKEKLKINFLNALITLAVIDGILWFMGKLINDLAYILLYVIIGFVGALVLELRKKSDAEEITELEEGIKKAKTDIIAEEYKKEQTNEKEVKPKVKVKIKK